MIWELDMDAGFALLAYAAEHNALAPMTRVSPGYIRQEIEKVMRASSPAVPTP